MVRQKVVRGKKPFAQFYTVKHEALLMDYLQEIFQGKSRNSIKSWLVHRQVAVEVVGDAVEAALHDLDLQRVVGEAPRRPSQPMLQRPRQASMSARLLTSR